MTIHPHLSYVPKKNFKKFQKKTKQTNKQTMEVKEVFLVGWKRVVVYLFN